MARNKAMPKKMQRVKRMKHRSKGPTDSFLQKAPPDLSRPFLRSRGSVDAEIRQRLQDEQMPSHTRLERHVAKSLSAMANQRNTNPFAFVATPMAAAMYPQGALNFLRTAAVDKARPGPDPLKDRVPTVNGVYRLPPPSSLPIGSRVVAPVSDVYSIQATGLPATFQRVAEGFVRV
jgi:hypothetical protein